MRVILILLLGATAACASTSGGLARVSGGAVVPPADACFAFTGMCAATVQFSVQPSGSVVDVSLKESSRDRACDQSIKLAVAKWRYEPRPHAVTVVERVEAYTCPSQGTAPNNSFKPNPLRGSA